MNIQSVLDRLPAPFHRAAVAMLGQQSALFRLRLRLKGLQHEPVPSATRIAPAPIRVYIAPVNAAEQARLWAAALTEHETGTSATHMMAPSAVSSGFESDLPVPLGAFHLSRQWQRNEFEAAAGATHVLNESLRPMFGGLFKYDAMREIAALRGRGVSTAVLAHGSEFRDPTHHRSRTPWSPFASDSTEVARLQRLAQLNRDRVRSLGVPLFVSTPDQLADLPEAYWLPLVVDPKPWASAGRPLSERGPLRVTHVPSSSWLKGTSLITPAVESLAARGVIHYDPLVSVPHAQMPSALGTADIVLEQFRLGSYGATAVEAMAAGRVVVGHVLPEVRSHVRAVTGVDLPIVEATPDTLESTLNNLAMSPESLIKISVQSREFARTAHDGKLSAEILTTRWLQTPSAE